MNSISYKVKKIGGGGDWQSYSSAAIKVSIGSAQHEGAKLAATLAWVENRFDHCFICLADTLQRYNLMLGPQDENWAYNAALTAGDEWLERNVSLIDGLKIPHTIHRWDNWLADERFTDALRAVKEASETDYTFASALDLDANAYLIRRDISPLSPAYKWKRGQARKYLKEELAVFSFWQNDLNAAEIYPGRGLIVEERVESGEIQSIPGLKNRSLVSLGLLRRVPAQMDQAA